MVYASQLNNHSLFVAISQWLIAGAKPPVVGAGVSRAKPSRGNTIAEVRIPLSFLSFPC